ncbi:MAG: glycoside hydrolase family 43 protein [Firmicutes bacterium]|nr:glycoside hydrolase family 43 protein [Bacillota bacterium]
MRYQNPILPGFYPDPSICRVGEWYYLVCSSFQFFPGVPLFESRDLLHWEQIGHVLTRQSQLPLTGADGCGGIYAPTIRYCDGVFYMVTTNVTNGGNFYVFTRDIHGEWSEPIFVRQDGIDPSLYFEGGKAYFMSNGTDDFGNSGIVQCEIDLATGKKLSPARCIWRGSGGRFLESPHLYKIGRYYYLLAAEGGTEYGHMVVCARSCELYGPYESHPGNPVLTNRNLGGYAIQGVGHADLVQDSDGNWWMVHLAFRQIQRWVQHHVTGREVCLVPVCFDESGWFTAGERGTCPQWVQTPLLPEVPQNRGIFDTFENLELGKQLVFLQNPDFSAFSMENGILTMRPSRATLSDRDGPHSFLGLRQRQMHLRWQCHVRSDGCEAGLSVYMMPDQHYDLALRGETLLRRLRLGDAVMETVVPIAGSEAVLSVEITPMAYRFSAVVGEKHYDLGTAAAKFLSSEVAGNFTGVMLALYAEGVGERAVFREYICESEAGGDCDGIMD